MEEEKTDWLQRTRILYGEKFMEKIAKSSVLIVGLGGVGAYAAEMLCRGGVGALTLVDADTIDITNINRQLPALHSTLGRAKVEVLAERFKDINPDVKLTLHNFFLDEKKMSILFQDKKYNFVVDAIDTIRCKCALLEYCLCKNIPVISAMGAGAKTDISRIQISDIWKTHQCGLSKVVRTYLRRDKMMHCHLPVVYSDEPVKHSAIFAVEGERNKKSTAGTVAYMTATFGCYLAAYVLEHLEKV